MKKKHFTSLFLLILSATAIGSALEFPVLDDSTEIEVVIYYEIFPAEKSSSGSNGTADHKFTLTVNLPQTIEGKQEITKIAFEPLPSKTFIENGNKYAEYDVPVPKEKTVIKIRIEATAFRYDLATAMKEKNEGSVSQDELKPFLIHERMIEKNDSAVKRISRKIKGDGELEIVKNIYKYLIRNLTVDVSKLKGVGAAETAKTKKGMCIDYCDLFVALCRAKNIPARVTAGYRTNFNISPKHSWVEVYLKEYGWVPFDVSARSNISEEMLDWRFYNLSARWLYFTSLRSDPVLHNNYFYCYPYWDGNFRKMIRPIVERIEFEKPSHEKHDSLKDVERTKKTINKYKIP